MSTLEISKDVYFDCDRKQLQYISHTQNTERQDNEEFYKDVNRYVIVREEMTRYIVKLLNCDKNVNNKIQYLADDIDKQREEEK